MSGWVSRPSTATLSPLSTLNTPSGRPASVHSPAIHSAADGTFSLGLSTTVLPAAMAIGKNHIGTMAGKLNGLMIATGPSGCRMDDTSTRVEAFSVKPPLIRCGMPQANSTTSWPRATSPRASDSTFPCSAVISSASSPARASSSSRNRNSTRARRASEVSRQAGNAALAAATAASTSAGAACASRAVTAPVAGSVTSESSSAGALVGAAGDPVRQHRDPAGVSCGSRSGRCRHRGVSLAARRPADRPARRCTTLGSSTDPVQRLLTMAAIGQREYACSAPTMAAITTNR